ncbi:hypothetical protein LZ31DRAFT_555243 [Colletotrichum somersetense]|nr:hypothetical protein LZ31DRAFT_555243 [Colletotrichum somersetense]
MSKLKGVGFSPGSPSPGGGERKGGLFDNPCAAASYYVKLALCSFPLALSLAYMEKKAFQGIR